MVPEEIKSVTDFVVSTLETHSTITLNNASNKALNRKLTPDELEDFIIRIQVDRKYLVQYAEGIGNFIYKNPKYDIEKLSESKLRVDTKLAQWTYYTYWVAFGFSIIGLVISIIALLKKG